MKLTCFGRGHIYFGLYYCWTNSIWIFFIIPDSDYGIALLVACFGLVSSVFWTLVNRGSRFWQSYWEHEISFVKSETRYHKVAFWEFFDEPDKYRDRMQEKWRDLKLWKILWDGKRFSPSRLMIALIVNLVNNRTFTIST